MYGVMGAWKPQITIDIFAKRNDSPYNYVVLFTTLPTIMHQSPHHKHTPLETICDTIYNNTNSKDQLLSCLRTQQLPTINNINDKHKHLINAGCYYLSQYNDVEQNIIRQRARNRAKMRHPRGHVAPLDIYHEIYKNAFRYLYGHTIQKKALSTLLKIPLTRITQAHKTLKNMKHKPIANLAEYMYNIDIISNAIKQHIA